MNKPLSKWLSLAVGVLVFICGIALVFTPYDAYVMISFFIPIAIIVHGVGSFTNYFSNKKIQAFSGWLLADGIISFALGVWLLFKPANIMLALPFIFGFWVLSGGCMRIAGSFAMKKLNEKWIWLLIVGIVGVISGIFLLYHPLLSGVIIAYLVAWSFILMGIQGIINFFVLEDNQSSHAISD